MEDNFCCKTGHALDSYSSRCLGGDETPEAALHSKISFSVLTFKKTSASIHHRTRSATLQWICEQEISCTLQSEITPGAISLTNTQAFTTSLRVLLILLSKRTQVLFHECIMETNTNNRGRFQGPLVTLCCLVLSIRVWHKRLFGFGERERGGILRHVGLTARVEREGLPIEGYPFVLCFGYYYYQSKRRVYSPCACCCRHVLTLAL